MTICIHCGKDCTDISFNFVTDRKDCMKICESCEDLRIESEMEDI